MKTTIITHFWNEEALLPFWLKHHRELFDHGVLIDYHSTDSSREIIKELVPTWEVHTTRNTEFWPAPCDDEVQSYELQHPGWKLALNVTEFLFLSSLIGFLKDFQWEFPDANGVRTTGMIMVDSAAEQATPLDPNKPLVLQRAHGYIEWHRRNCITQNVYPSRCRFLHRRQKGGYSPGRHFIHDYTTLDVINNNLGQPQLMHYGAHQLTGVHPHLYLCWYGKFSPYEQIKKRYLNLNKKRVSTANPTEWSDYSQLPQYDQELIEERTKSIYLPAIPQYRKIFDEISEKFK